MIGSGLPAPTVAEALRMRLIGEAGCIACEAFAQVYSPCEVHHLTVGGKHGAPRLGHAYTVGLCPWHHRGEPLPRLGGGFLSPTGCEQCLGPSYAVTPSRFRTVFGGDKTLMVLQRWRIDAVLADYVLPPRGWADPDLSILEAR